MDSGAFDFRWPQVEEHFTHGWEGSLHHRGHRHRFLHGVGARDVYGRRRAHTVTFFDGQPLVEGVAADDFETSASLLSLIKPWRGHKLARDPRELPSQYSQLEVVSHADEIQAPYSKRCLAVKIKVDDLQAWGLHAALRHLARSRAKP